MRLPESQLSQISLQLIIIHSESPLHLAKTPFRYAPLKKGCAK
jgi:hypothetical protein